MTELIDQLRQIALDRAQLYADHDFIIRGLWRIQLLFRPNINERIFNYTIVSAQTRGQGCCYCHSGGEELTPADLMGQDARKVHAPSRYTEIALLDAVFSAFPTTPMATFVLDGYAADKTVQRTNIVVREVLQQICGARRVRPQVVNVGVVGNFVKALIESGVVVKATDLDMQLIGSSIHGVEVESGDRTLPLVAESDVALITGMTLATNTLGNIIETARQSGTRLVMFAETGAHFAEVYCQRFGVDVVVSEPFPFYIFQGRSVVNVYRCTPNR
jgi:hypothetical protein